MKLQSVTAFALVASLVYRCMRTGSQCPAHHDKVINLQFVEKMLFGETVATATYFKGPVPEEYLKKRISLILEANPWLAGRIKNRSQISYPSVLGDREKDHSFFKVVKGIPDIHDGTPQESLRSLLRTYIRMSDEVDFGLFSVVAFPTESGFLLLMTVSHVLVDGCSFYRIYSMLSSDASISALNPTRKPGHWSLTSYCPSNFPYHKICIFLIVKSLAKVFCPSLLPPEVCGTFKINKEYIESKKQQHDGDRFLSTNDIVSGWWFSEFPNKAYWLVACNMRGKVQTLSNNDAGNYVGSLVLVSDEQRKPSGIRRVLSEYQKGNPTAFNDPGMKYWLAENMCLASNWSSFYSKLSIPNCEERLHVPLMVSEGDVCVIFKSSEDDLCAYIQSTGTLPSGGPLGQKIHVQ
eukprot:TRINITY_DN5736_c1_g1_i1.p1 TRINITY_DN5736_c1_g1~~TRINITY_DN5736_c1_g1_i1.p1  ORF type:complete len:414 (+),score=47.50 TRINITY_DN5736_c1_g1_i1:23-1243(+)